MVGAVLGILDATVPQAPEDKRARVEEPAAAPTETAPAENGGEAVEPRPRLETRPPPGQPVATTRFSPPYEAVAAEPANAATYGSDIDAHKHRGGHA